MSTINQYSLGFFLAIALGAGCRLQPSSNTTNTVSADSVSAHVHNMHGRQDMQQQMHDMFAMPITLTSAQERLAGIHTFPVGTGQVVEIRRLTGTTVFDPTQITTYSPVFSGWITKLYVNNPGEYVRAHQPLFQVYSPDLAADEQTYLTAIQHRAPSDTLFLHALERRLLRRGLNRQQIEAFRQLITSGKSVHHLSIDTLTVYSTTSGYLTAKLKQEGDYVAQGQSVVQLTRTSTFWVQAQLSPEDISILPLVKDIRIELPAHPQQIFTGRIAFSNPAVQPQSMVYLLNIVISDPQVHIQPGELAYVELEIDTHKPYSSALQVPASAIMFETGQPLVWVQQKPHTYVRKKIDLGPIHQGWAAVWQGLKPGEQVVAQGAYLLNSQYELIYGSGVNMAGMQMSDMNMKGRSQ
ncbi:MAG: efflux RND transporter periplasmic adaptor subunit [Thermoflavifilum sp.]|nr:efflux RND transporter periplasmic adaptor subunit [Thermoflavifilum sp.]